MRGLAIGLAVLMAGVGASVASAELEVKGGLYKVEGKNLDGSSYSGTARIKITSDTTCEIVWNTGSTSSGICMRDSDSFAAAYRSKNAVGLVIYKIRDVK